MSARIAGLTAALVTVAIAGCGGGGGNQPQPVPQPPVTPDPWAPVTAELQASSIDDLALIVGNASGEQYRFEKGGFRVANEYAIASASKWLTGATIVALVEQGVMSLADQPQDYLAYWTDDPADPRSRITLTQLLSFTSGFHRGPSLAGCIGDESYDVQSCVAEWYGIGVDAEPGTTYYYGPVHMQVAAAMAEIATGQSWSEITQLTVASPLGLSATGFAGDNPRASGSATSTALEYAEFLRAQLTGEFLATGFDELADQRLDGVHIVSRPASIEAANVDWYYGLGVWRECDAPTWNADCEANVRISSPGAFGWYPWLDLENGYYAVLAMEERFTFVNSPTEISAALGARLRPLILEALAN